MYPDVPLRNLWELMINIENRPKWDSMCQEALNLESMGTGKDRTKAHRREASVDYLATKGMFLIKANDMVLLSINARLYPTDKVRLVCATTSCVCLPVYRSFQDLSHSFAELNTRISRLRALSLECSCQYQAL